MRFQCPMCKGIVSVEDSEMGSTVQCGHCNKPVDVPSSRTASGSVIGDFIILHELGRGGMGIVYEAHQISLDRPAALKILAESYAKNAEFVVGFIKEARAAAKLNHPNIVQAYAVGDDDGIFYFAMEYIDGETMNNILKRENVLSVDQSVDIVRQIAEALDYAWQEEKLVHRDIKPDNIMLTSSGRAKLADLGLAKVGNDSGRAEGDEVMGTPQYISPEQLTGDELDNRTDIYCLGATFYHFLTGRFPYEGATALEIAKQHLEGTLIPPSQVNPAVPEAVSKVVEKMMAKEPSQRYQTAGQLAEDLALIKRGKNPSVFKGAAAAPKLKIPGIPKVGAPKLHIPGKSPASGNSAENKPKITLPGDGSAEPAANSPAKGETKKPKLAVKKPEPVPAPAPVPAENPKPAGNVPQPVRKKKKGEEGPGTAKIIVRIVVSLILLLLLAAGGAFCYFTFVKKENPVEVLNQAKTAIEKATAEPEPSEFMKNAGPLIEKIRNPQKSSEADIARQCYDFLKKRITPETPEEIEIQKNFISCFVRYDEPGVEEARTAAISAYEEELERKRLAAEEDAQKKLKAENQARIQEAERKRKEAERRKQEGERKRIQARKDGFKKQIAQRERKMLLELIRCGEKHDAEAFTRILDKNIAVAEELSRPDFLKQDEFTSSLSPLVNRAKSLKKTMEKAWELDKVFTDGDPQLAGLNIELNFNICTLTEIKGGVIHAKAGSKKFSVPVDSLLNNKKFRLFALRAADRLGKKDSLPYYFFWRGAFRPAAEIALDISPKGKSRYSAFVRSWLQTVMKDPKNKAMLLKKFRGIPEYDNLNPPPRKPAPKRPAAKKPAARKPAARKTAARKPAAKKK